MKLDKIPNLVVIIFFILLALLWWGWMITLNLPKNSIDDVLEPLGNNLIIVQNNTLVGTINPIYFPPIIHTYTLGCMMKKESTYNPNAYNPNDPNGGSCGCLQFQKPTFQEFCIDKYHLSNSVEDVWNCDISRRCADRMISDGYGYLWTTWDNCI